MNKTKVYTYTYRNYTAINHIVFVSTRRNVLNIIARGIDRGSEKRKEEKFVHYNIHYIVRIMSRPLSEIDIFMKGYIHIVKTTIFLH